MNISITYETIMSYLRTGLDILIVWILINYIIKVVGNNQRTVQLFQGVVLVVIIQALSKLLGLTTVEWLANNVVSWGFLAIIVIFQPEIRSILEKIGKSNTFARITVLTNDEREALVDDLLEATAILASSKTGALITLEQSISLNDYIKTGIKLDSMVSAELLVSIFSKTTPLHDGAVIIQGDKISCASAYFPPTARDLPSKYGSRHRAAIGISEVTDAVTIVVSEESGRVSVTYEGKIIHMNEKRLREFLDKLILNKNITTKKTGKVKSESVDIEQLLQQTGSDAEEEFEGNNKHTMKTFQTQSFKTDEIILSDNDKKVSDSVAKTVVKAIKEADDNTTHVEINVISTEGEEPKEEKQ